MTDIAGLGRRARLDAGTLGVVAVTVNNALQAATLLCGARSQGLTTLTGGEVVVDADVPQIPVGIDGETVMCPPGPLRHPVHGAAGPGVQAPPRDPPGQTLDCPRSSNWPHSAPQPHAPNTRTDLASHHHPEPAAPCFLAAGVTPWWWSPGRCCLDT